MRRAVCSALLTLPALVLGSGCGGSPEFKTVQGLQEENRSLREQVADAKKQLEAERVASESGRSGQEKEFEDRLARLQQLNREKAAQLEGEIASLRLELGNVQREKLVLQETLEQQPRVEEGRQVRYGVERTVWIVLLAVTLIALVLVAGRHHALRSQLHLLLVQRVAEARRIGVSR